MVYPRLLNSKTLKKERIQYEWIVNEESTEETTLLSIPKSVKKEKKSNRINTPVGEKKGKVPKAENTTVEKLQTKSLKKEIPEGHVNDSIESLEQKFNVNSESIMEAVKGIIKFHAKNPKLQNQLFEERVPLFLQISCHKIPSGHPKILRINLPNSVLTPDDEVCLIVPEVKGIKNIEHEKHLEHYEELLRKKGIENIKKIMTFHEFRTEYETFEQKSRLADLYDVFLVDGKICGKVVGKCSKIFYKKRKVPIPVKLHVTKLKDHIEKALSKVFCHIHLKGDSFIVQIGHNKMDLQDLVENVFSIMECLNKEFPGGFDNIKGLHAFIARAPSIPIYMSFKTPNEIKAKVKSKKPKAHKSYEGELTTLPNAEVLVRPSGKVLVTRKKNKDEHIENVITDTDIIKTNKYVKEKADGEDKKKRKKNEHQEEVSDKKVAKKKKKSVTVDNSEVSLKKQNENSSSVIILKTVKTTSDTGENFKNKSKKVKIQSEKAQKNKTRKNNAK
ncbi:hypothetical protein NQ314_014680 [Rhamnusium bicolor]|uniref:Ribosomal protein L1 n=1 Tax=Rhamnusium bicolor TaxID=1586634 RepID=A0AAV8X0C7_9CUCU|nr:hypothetical protein NQ314_014680 [Rhamnusium bicolor]